MSVGEMRAIEELRAHFRRLYLPEFEVNFTEDLPDAKTYDSTLLCLGGPDTSPIAAQTWSAAPTSFKWGEHERHDVSIHDSTSKYPVLKPEGWQDARGRRGLAVRGGSRGQGAVTRDYGLVVKMPNPFAQRQPERGALLFAGCLGYGTWGAVRFSITETFTQHPLVLAEDAVECLLAVDVLGDAPQRIEVMDVRPLAIEP
jgi:hypothetical protein